MKLGTDSTEVTKLLWSLLLALGLTAGLLVAFALRPAAEAQVAGDDGATMAETNVAAVLPAFTPAPVLRHKQDTSDLTQPTSWEDRGLPPQPWFKSVSPLGPPTLPPERPVPPWPGFGHWPPRPGGLMPQGTGKLDLQGLHPFNASPAITISLTGDSLWGYTFPNATLTATLRNGSTFKGLAVAIVDGLGWFGDVTHFFDQGKVADVAGGDTVEVFVNGAKTTLTLPTITGSIDPATDVVSGTISGVSLPASLTIIAHGNSRVISSDASGNFSTDWTGTADIVQDDRADVAYEMAPGYWAAATFHPQNGFTVYETWNGMWGYTTPGDTVTVTLRSTTGTLKESGTPRFSGTADGGTRPAWTFCLVTRWKSRLMGRLSPAL